MGHRLTPAEEAQQLRQATREAHEAMQGLNDAIRRATQLAATLASDYQAYHDREMKDLANTLTIEHNHISAQLNQSIEQAKIMIRDHIMRGEAVFDRTTSTVTIRWDSTRFNDREPLPYPDVPPEECPQ